MPVHRYVRCGADPAGADARDPGYTNAGGVGYFGPRTRAAYAKWQQALGLHGADANGIPGYTSLKKLGDKYGFRVVR